LVSKERARDGDERTYSGISDDFHADTSSLALTTGDSFDESTADDNIGTVSQTEVGQELGDSLLDLLGSCRGREAKISTKPQGFTRGSSWH
jgi:hypothetical protein